MRALLTLALCAAVPAGYACAAEDEVPAAGRRAAPAAQEKPQWDFAATVYPTAVRGGNNYTSAIVAADRGALHLEARVNYESVGARSAFIGWTWSGGETLTWELTPIIGGAWGSVKAVVPGLEASLAWGMVDAYVEAEYVHDRDDRTGSYLYAWSELGVRPLPWLRLGLAAQRTRAYGGDREVQRGPFAQVTWRRVTLGAYWFNPGSQEQVVVGMVGVAF